MRRIHRLTALAGVFAGCVLPTAAHANALPANDARRLLGVLAEPYTATDGTLVDPITTDAKNAWLSSVDQFRTSSGARVRVVLRFRTWGQGLANADDVKLLAAGYEPQLTLQPTSSMPIATIASGGGDAWLIAQLQSLQAAVANASTARGETLHAFLRFAHEMNGNWYAWGAPTGSPTAAQLAAAQTTYKSAFRRVAGLAHTYAPSVDLIWAANRSSTPNTAANDLARWYPGDAYVDWIAVDGYNRTPTDWRTPTVVYDAFRTRWATTQLDIGGDPLADHTANSKPLMIAETSTIDKASTGTGTDATYLQQLRTYLAGAPQFRAIIWFNRAKRCSDFSSSLTCSVVNWNPQDGVATKSLPWDWNSTTAGATAFKALVQDTTLFLPGPA